MARNPEAPSRMEVLILSSLYRLPMHGYELKLELRYKHVRWWAKAEHGHLYAALARLEKRKLIKPLAKQAPAGRGKRVYAITEAGKRHLERALLELGSGKEQTFFDVDLFLSAAFTLPKKRVLALLAERTRALDAQREEARALYTRMSALIPAVGRLIIQHRIEHFEHELAFTKRAIAELKKDASWKPMLGAEHVDAFIARTGVALE